jgi:hypothetical protein
VRSGVATAPERGRGESGSLGQGSEEHVTGWAVTGRIEEPYSDSPSSHIRFVSRPHFLSSRAHVLSLIHLALLVPLMWVLSGPKATMTNLWLCAALGQAHMFGLCVLAPSPSLVLHFDPHDLEQLKTCC